MSRSAKTKSAEMVDVIRRFVHGSIEPYEWDDFMGIPFEDAILEYARIECEMVLRDSEAGIDDENSDDRLLAIAQRLEARDERSGDSMGTMAL